MSSNQVYTLQFISRDAPSSTYILFTSVIDIQQAKMEKLEVVAAGQVENFGPIQLSVSTHKDIVKVCQKLKYEGKQLKNLTNKLTDLFQTSGKSDDFMEQLIHYLNSENNDQIKYILNQVINQAAGNSKPDIQFFYTILDRSKLNEESLKSLPEDPPSNEVDEDLPPLEPTSFETKPAETLEKFIPSGSRVIPMKYVLSPVSGIQINTLKPGDKIMIQLLKSDPSSQSIIESMKLETPEGQIRPLPGTVVASRNNGVENETVIQIGSDVFGKIYEEENSIKVRPYSGEKPIQVEEKKTSTSKSSSRGSKTSEDAGLLITILIALGILGIVITAISLFLL
ncbi:hypothetical protein [Leptospira santarosai]|uniref:hypothetical protein n=1 Tax=Leptospira santarosai TaxID=28183 RepID=UPI0007741296|nr:hypothetical protein [Leptospira santarosai]